ncbi:MAG TPA: PAS domain S-box protein [Herpetosiphonaceae bacterium]
MDEPTAPPATPETFLQWMRAREAALTERLVAAVRDQIAFYAGLPLAAVQAGVAGTVGRCVDALENGDYTPATEFITGTLTTRAGQGLSFSQSVMLPVVFRRAFYDAALPAVCDTVAGAAEGLALLMEICDRTVVILSRLYQERFEAAAAELSRFKTLAEQAIDGILVTDNAGRISYANPAFRRLLGYGDELIGMRSAEVIHESDHERMAAAITPAIRVEGSWRGLLAYRHRDGTPIPTELAAVLISAPDGEIQAITTIVRDVREQQARDARLHMFELLVENTSDGVMVADTEDIITYVNPALVRMGGLRRREDAIGKPIGLFFTDEANQRLENEVKPAVRREGSYSWRVWSKGPGKTMFLGETSSFLITDRDGQPIGIGGFVRDITAEHRAEEERARLQEQIIAAQQEALRELSTPVIPISDHVLVLPLIGGIDSRRAQQILEALLGGIQQHRARAAILDITGVPIVDTQVANALVRAAQAARLLGAAVMLTGIRPEVAQTLVGLGAGLGDLNTHASLQSAVIAALSRADAGGGGGR